jgi:hypothetical protein
VPPILLPHKGLGVLLYSTMLFPQRCHSTITDSCRRRGRVWSRWGPGWPVARSKQSAWCLGGAHMDAVRSRRFGAMPLAAGPATGSGFWGRPHRRTGALGGYRYQAAPWTAVTRSADHHSRLPVLRRARRRAARAVDVAIERYGELGISTGSESTKPPAGWNESPQRAQLGNIDVRWRRPRRAASWAVW